MAENAIMERENVIGIDLINRANRIMLQRAVIIVV